MQKTWRVSYTLTYFCVVVIYLSLATVKVAAAAPPLKMIAQLDAPSDIREGLDAAKKRALLNIDEVPANRIGPKLLVSTGSDLEEDDLVDLVLVRRNAMQQLMSAGMLAALDDIQPGEFSPPQIPVGSLLKWEGRVHAVCFGDYRYSYANRPCLAVLASSRRKLEAARSIAYVYMGQPQKYATVTGEAQRIIEAFLTSLFIDCDYKTAWTYIYTDPSYHPSMWTRESFLDMTHNWVYRQVPGYRVVVDPNETLVESGYRDYKGTVIRVVALVEWLQNASAPTIREMIRMPSGRYYLGRTFIIRLVQQDQEWRILSRPYSLFD